ncbi:MAG TPA: arylamine N-acetyltransferase [Streptosporangiaceae bacterium]
MTDGTMAGGAMAGGAMTGGAMTGCAMTGGTAAGGTGDEWRAGLLDLDAYLTRVGFAGALEPTWATLAALHRAHVAAIPFENLDVFLGRGVRVDLGSVQAKLVAGRRGGYCYEHGVLFAAVLERIGYQVDRLLARIGYKPRFSRPRTHMTLHVTGRDGQWLADVGFGAGLLEPLPWDASGRAHTQGGWTYRIAEPEAGTWVTQQASGGKWLDLYTIVAEPQHASDVDMSNYFTSTHPRSPFTGHAIVMRKTADVQHRLRDRDLTTIWPDGTSTERALADAEIIAALREMFGLPLTGEEVARVLATLPPLVTSPSAGLAR